MARIVVVATDLMLASKVDATLRAAGHEVTISQAIGEAAFEGADLVIADLELGEPDSLAGHGVPVLGYFPHTKPEIREAAEAAGVDLAVPRSRMARETAELVERMLA